MAAGVEQVTAATGPRRVRRRIDLEAQSIAFFAPRRAGLVGRSIGHLDRDQMIIGMGIGFHRDFLGADWFPTSPEIRRGPLPQQPRLDKVKRRILAP